MPQARNALFIRTGWMVWYDKRREPFGPTGGGSFNVENIGSEVNNFQPKGGRLYGWAETGGAEGGFNLARIAPNRRRSDVVENVTILMYATAPDRPGQRLVGWYRSARCRRVAADSRPGGMYGVWNFDAPAARATLLSLDARTLIAPDRHNGGFGQRNVRYARDDAGKLELGDWMRRALAFTDSYAGPNLLRGGDPGEMPSDVVADAEGQGVRVDARARRAVERRAMHMATAALKREGFRVQDVSRHESFDLWCVNERTGDELRVEVKGTTAGPDFVWVTAGEVACARSADPRVAMVVVSRIVLRKPDTEWVASGGICGWLSHLEPLDRDLKPSVFFFLMIRRPPRMGR